MKKSQISLLFALSAIAAFVPSSALAAGALDDEFKCLNTINWATGRAEASAVYLGTKEPRETILMITPEGIQAFPLEGDWGEHIDHQVDNFSRTHFRKLTYFDKNGSPASKFVRVRSTQFGERKYLIDESVPRRTVDHHEESRPLITRFFPIKGGDALNPENRAMLAALVNQQLDRLYSTYETNVNHFKRFDWRHPEKAPKRRLFLHALDACRKIEDRSVQATLAAVEAKLLALAEPKLPDSVDQSELRDSSATGPR